MPHAWFRTWDGSLEGTWDGTCEHRIRARGARRHQCGRRYSSGRVAFCRAASALILITRMLVRGLLQCLDALGLLVNGAQRQPIGQRGDVEHTPWRIERPFQPDRDVRIAAG